MTKPKSGRYAWFKFNPRRWLSDIELRSCSPAARGAWADMLCAIHEANAGGHLLIAGKVPTVATLAKLVGVSVREYAALERELEDFDVFSRRASDGAILCRKMAREDEAEGSPQGLPSDTPRDTPKEPEGLPPSRAVSPLSSSSSSGGGRGGGRKLEASPAEIDAAFAAAAPLDKPECRAAWDRWMRHRREIRKPVTTTSADAAIAGYAKRGPAAFVTAIEHTIAKGWQGLRDPDPDERGSSPTASVRAPRSIEPADAADVHSRWMIAMGRDVRDSKARGIPDYPGYSAAKAELERRAS